MRARRPGPRSQVASERLFALDRLEQRLEIAFAEAACAVALYDLEEERRPVLRRLREELEQIAVLVAVDEDPQAPQVFPRLVDLAYTIECILVVRVGRVEEEHAPLAQRFHSGDDVLGSHRDVLDARAAVVVEVLLDLALALALGRLV